jgi:hypothetical protein
MSRVESLLSRVAMVFLSPPTHIPPSGKETTYTSLNGYFGIYLCLERIYLSCILKSIVVVQFLVNVFSIMAADIVDRWST